MLQEDPKLGSAFAGIAVAALLLTASANAQSSHPDFSGTWRQDTAQTASVGGGRGSRENAGGGRGGGLGLGPAATELVITQNATMLTVIERRDTTTNRIVYSLTEASQQNALPAGRNAGVTANYTSAWKSQRLETRVIIPAAAGRERLEYIETRFLDGDGSLVVETTTPAGTNTRHLVYRRTRP